MKGKCGLPVDFQSCKRLGDQMYAGFPDSQLPSAHDEDAPIKEQTTHPNDEEPSKMHR